MTIAYATGWEPATVRALTLTELGALARAMKRRSRGRR